MIKWLSVLWVVTCVAVLPSTSKTVDIKKVPAKQTSKPIEKKIESLTVQRLPKTVVRIQEQSTLQTRKGIAAKAEKMIRQNGIKSDKMITAMLVNAWYESRWKPSVSDGPCVGFFQLHVKYMGKGSSIGQLKNLEHNVNKLMNSDHFKEWVQWCKENPKATAGQMSYRFASTVERCAKKHRYQRKTTADRWYRAIMNA